MGRPIWMFFHLTLPCWLWDRTPWKRCKHHGFHAQNWLTGSCKKCNETAFIRFGRWLNEFLKSYGKTKFRRWLVRRVSSLIAQIEFEEYRKMRCTPIWRDKDDRLKMLEEFENGQG